MVRISVRVKAIIGATALIVLTALMLNIFLTRHEKKLIQDNILRKSLSVTSTLAYNSEYYVLTANKVALETLIEVVMREHDVLYCSVFDAKGDALASRVKKSISQDELKGAVIVKEYPYENQRVFLKRFKATGQEYCEVDMYVVSGARDASQDEFGILPALNARTRQENVGTVRLGVSLSSVIELTEEARKTVALLTVIMILISGAVTIFASAVMLKPLNALTKGTHEVAAGNMDIRIELKTGDEFEDLAGSFNAMVEKLHETMVSRDSLANEISGRLAAEKTALEAKADWEDSFNAINDMITIHDVDFNIIQANKAAESGLGRAMSDILTNKCFTSYHGKNYPPEGCPSRKVLQTGEISVTELFEPRLSKFVEIKALPRFDAHHKLIGLVHIVRDITERKKMEEKLRAALKEEMRSREIMTSMLEDSSQIGEKLERNLSELKQAQAMLVQSAKLASLGRLVSDMAHEVNNPLMIISGNAQLSLLDNSLGEEIKKNLHIIHEECNRAKSIIQRLLMFSRPSKGEQKPLDINRNIESVVRLLQHQYGLSNVKVYTQFAKDLPPVRADEKQFQEVIMNLLNNARDAMPGGGGGGGGGVIDVSTSLDGERVKIEIKDSGTGMDEATLVNIFEPFFTTKEKGTGLGLSVCYGIIKAHNGELKITSQLNKGTTATIILPIAQGGI